MIPSANIIPALGPPTWSSWKSTFRGKSYWATRYTPSCQRCESWSRVSFTCSVTVLPSRRTTTSAPRSPAASSCSRSCAREVTSVPFTETIRSPARSAPSAAPPGITACTVRVVVNGFPRWFSAAATESSWDVTMAAALDSSTCWPVVSGG